MFYYITTITDPNHTPASHSPSLYMMRQFILFSLIIAPLALLSLATVTCASGRWDREPVMFGPQPTPYIVYEGTPCEPTHVHFGTFCANRILRDRAMGYYHLCRPRSATLSRRVRGRKPLRLPGINMHKPATRVRHRCPAGHACIPPGDPLWAKERQAWTPRNGRERMPKIDCVLKSEIHLQHRDRTRKRPVVKVEDNSHNSAFTPHEDTEMQEIVSMPRDRYDHDLSQQPTSEVWPEVFQLDGFEIEPVHESHATLVGSLTQDPVIQQLVEPRLGHAWQWHSAEQRWPAAEITFSLTNFDVASSQPSTNAVQPGNQPALTTTDSAAMVDVLTQDWPWLEELEIEALLLSAQAAPSGSTSGVPPHE